MSEEAYIYAADMYCEACGEDIRKRLTAEGHRPKHWDDETTYDSGEFPKGPYPDGGGESDSPQHCGSHGECLSPTIIDGEKYGRFLENPLTNAGCAYVLEMHMDGPNAVTEFWMEHYHDEIESYLKTHPGNPYHVWYLRQTLEEIALRVRRNFDGDDEGESDDPTSDMLEHILTILAERHDISVESLPNEDDEE